jgi:hypothetical protein
VVATEPEFYDRLYECFPQIDAQRRWWKDFDIEQLINNYAEEGWDGVTDVIDDYMIGDSKARRAKAYAAEFRKKHALDPHSYPINWLIRNLLLNELTTTSASPVGPKTRAYTVRQKAAEEAS